MRALVADELEQVAFYRTTSRAAVRYALFAESVRSRLHLFGIILEAIDAVDAQGPGDDDFAALMLTEIAQSRRIRGSSAALAEVFETFRAHAERAVLEGVQP
ncbi:MAG: hypothetical protein GY946_17715 [bacterium]|nr:hypothetical protein [bacterium]